MKNDWLEKCILKNRKRLDLDEPGNRLWHRIDARLQERRIKRPSVRQLVVSWSQVAAAVLVIAFCGIMIGDRLQPLQNLRASKKSANVQYQDWQDALVYYEIGYQKKLKNLKNDKQISASDKAELLQVMNEFDLEYARLKDDLKEQMNHERVLDAMLENCRKRMQLLDDVVEQITEEKDNETIDIYL